MSLITKRKYFGDTDHKTYLQTEMDDEVCPADEDNQGPVTSEVEEIARDLSIVTNFVDAKHEIKHVMSPKIISALRELADRSDKIEHDVKIADIVGNGVGIAGSVATIGSIVAAPFTAGLSLVLFIGGTATAAAGGLTSVGARVTSMVSTNRTIKEAQTLLNELDASAGQLARLLREASEALERLTFKFLQREKWSKLFESVIQSRGQISEKELVTLLQAFLSELPNRKDLRIIKLPENILGIKKGFEAYINLLRNPELGKQAQKLLSKGKGPDVLKDVTKVFKGTPLVMSATERALGGIFAGMTILFSVINIVQISKSNKETVAAAQLRKIANDLEDYFKDE